MKRNDTLWKGILEDLFDDFLRFFYPNADDIFDMSRGFDFLDKELAELFPELETENVRYVDKLVKVWLKNGEEEWILIHIEVQGISEREFAERMFIYYYRIRDRYSRKVTAWAILTDKNKKFYQTKFEESFLGTMTIYQFNVFKVIQQDEASLKKSDNPFAIVVLTVLLALKKSKSNELELIDLKIDLVKHPIQKSITKEKIRGLMNFLTHYVRFNNENTLIFEQKLQQFTGKKYPMGIEQLLLHQAETKGEKRAEKLAEKRSEQRLAEIICNARLTGLSIEKIATIVNLPAQKVRSILDKMGIE